MTTWQQSHRYVSALAAGAERTRLRSVLRAVIATPADPVATIARLALGLMILPHGMQKLFGAFDGYGFAGTMTYFTETLGIPWAFALLAIVAEFFGGLGLIAGLLGRIAALGVGSVMVTAAVMRHVEYGFFMNWAGQLPAGAEGFEFFLLALALAAIVVVRGSGSLSIDGLLNRPRRSVSSAPGSRKGTWSTDDAEE